MIIRGLHIELRGQRMRTERIIEVMRDAAMWGYNTIMLEYCDKFPYQGRLAPAVAPDALTVDEIGQINAAAEEFGQQIMPLVQCLGHLYWLLRMPSLASLGEGFDNPRQLAKRPHGCATSTCPSRPESLELFKEMAEQVLEMHPDCHWFHIGGDEVSLDEDCPHCKPRRETEGVPGILGAHYAKVADWMRSKGHEPVMWCDMLLRNPDTLAFMKGKAAIMDWDYWSTTEPAERAVIWGIKADQLHKPEEWSEAHQRIVKPYVFTEDGRIKPFPYTPLLVDYGFQVMAAPAARSAGDTFFAPKAESVDNVIGAALAARRNDTLGVVVTSWALRRAPWPLTEYALMAGAMVLDNPDVDRETIDSNFAREHFGVSNAELARIPRLVGAKANPLTSSDTYLDRETGHWFGNSYAARIERLKANPDASLKLFETILDNLRQAQALLDCARPTTQRQRDRIEMWQWCIDCSTLYAELGPLTLREPAQLGRAELCEFRKRIEDMQTRTEKLLSPWLSDFTMVAERQARFGIALDWVDEVSSQLPAGS